MIKRFSLAFSFLFVFTGSLLAQDVLIKLNGDELTCKVLEVGSISITYSLPSSNDSIKAETQSIAKTEVFMIRYANGSKDVFTAQPEPDYAKAPTKIEEPISENIEVEGRRFYYHHRKLGKTQLIRLLRNEKNKEINALVSKSIVCSVFSPILKFATIPCGVIGFFIVGLSSNTYSDITPEQKTWGEAGIAALVLGQAGGYTLDFFHYKNLKEAVALYNTKHP